MLFYTICTECMELKMPRLARFNNVGVGIAPGDEPGDGAIWAELSDKGFVEGTCSKGHRSRTVLQAMRFELLFDFALLAFLDGYQREAMNTAAVAIERFYEFYLAAGSAQRGLSREKFDVLWKDLAYLSERQLGAVKVMHALGGGSAKFPDGDWTKRRNKATHKGYYPTRKEAHDFLEETRTIIIGLGRDLRVTCPEGVKQAYWWALMDAHEGANAAGGPAGGLSMERAINWNVSDQDFGKRTLDEEIELLKQRRAQWWRPD